MSSGHHHRAEPRLGEHEINEVLSDPRIKARLASKPQISFAFDVPYLAGYSQDARIVYVDRHLPARALPVSGHRTINVLPFLIVHETVEKAVIDILGKDYAYAHEVASQAEDRAVRAAGYLPGKYNEWLKPYIKADEHEQLKKVPPDLDLKPYVDSHDIALLFHLRQKMNQEKFGKAMA